MMRDLIVILGHRVKCCDQLWPPARGCHALHCVVVFVELEFGIFAPGAKCDWKMEIIKSGYSYMLAVYSLCLLII